MINERFISNEIKAQEASFNALQSVARKVDKVLGLLYQKNVIISYNVLIKPYNSGYKLQVDTDYFFETLHTIYKQNVELISVINDFLRLELAFYPNAFFNEHIEDGDAKVSFDFLNQNFNVKHHEREVYAIEKLDDIVEDYYNLLVPQLNEMYSFIDNNLGMIE